MTSRDYDSRDAYKGIHLRTLEEVRGAPDIGRGSRIGSSYQQINTTTRVEVSTGILVQIEDKLFMEC